MSYYRPSYNDDYRRSSRERSRSRERDGGRYRSSSDTSRGRNSGNGESSRRRSSSYTRGDSHIVSSYNSNNNGGSSNVGFRNDNNRDRDGHDRGFYERSNSHRDFETGGSSTSINHRDSGSGGRHSRERGGGRGEERSRGGENHYGSNSRGGRDSDDRHFTRDNRGVSFKTEAPSRGVDYNSRYSSKQSSQNDSNISNYYGGNNNQYSGDSNNNGRFPDRERTSNNSYDRNNNQTYGSDRGGDNRNPHRRGDNNVSGDNYYGPAGNNNNSSHILTGSRSNSNNNNSSSIYGPAGNNNNNSSSYGPSGNNNSSGYRPSGNNNNNSSYGPGGNNNNNSSYGPSGNNNNNSSYGPGGNNNNNSGYGPSGNNNSSSYGPSGNNNNNSSHGPGGNNNNNSSYGPSGNNNNNSSYGPGRNNNNDYYGPGGNNNSSSYEPSGNNNNSSYRPSGNNNSGRYGPSGNNNSNSYGLSGNKNNSSYGPGGNNNTSNYGSNDRGPMNENINSRYSPNYGNENANNNRMKDNNNNNNYGMNNDDGQNALRREAPPLRHAYKRDPSYQYSNTVDAISNLIVADLTEHFHFFQYGTDCYDNKGKTIESRRIRQDLFFQGIAQLCQKKNLTQKAMGDLNRSIFFEGPFFFGARALPGLEHPSKVDSRKGYCLIANDTGKFIITKMRIFGKPDSLSLQSIQREGDDECLPAPKKQNRSVLLADYRCSNCCSSFTSQNAILIHCQKTGHKPIYGDDLKGMLETPNQELFLSYCNVALQRALGERMVRWGGEYIDPKTFTEPKDRQGRPLGLKVFRAFACDFGCMSADSDQTKDENSLSSSLILSVDLRAKMIRTQNLLNLWAGGQNPRTVVYTPQMRNNINKNWLNEQIICTYDKKSYGIVEILFDESPASLPISSLNISHAEYFLKKKGIQLQFPDAKPMIKTLGRNKQPIFLPAELVCGNEIDQKAKSMLPLVASFAPPERNDAINEMKRYLTPGAQKTKGPGGGFLPALGIVLRDERVKVRCRQLSLPSIIAAGLAHTIPEAKKNNWLGCLRDAQFSVNPNSCVVLNVVVVYNHRLSRNYMEVYKKIERLVNNFGAKYRFPPYPYACVEAGDIEDHWESVEQYFRHNEHNLPPNIFVIDFTKPPHRSSVDQAYKVVKQMLGKAGYLSQFVNFNSADHTDHKQTRKSNSILVGVSRQILNKCGLRIWWIDLPKTIPLPAVFVGADVFHAQRKYDPKVGKMTARSSCAAAVIQLIRYVDGSREQMSTVEIYSTTERRESGKEVMLGSFLNTAIKEALSYFRVNPLSCIVWRDGVGVSSFNSVISNEVESVRSAFSEMALRSPFKQNPVDLAYVICQKDISTKFITVDGKRGMQPGAMIRGLNLSNHDTFYINGSSPSFSTPKPVRFVVLQKDKALDAIQLPELAWALCHDYPNWTGPIRVPSHVQMAHKLAELAGNYDDCGESINKRSFANTMHFL